MAPLAGSQNIPRPSEVSSLRAMTLATAAPFALPLVTRSGEKASIRCEQVRRLFPGRRLTCSAYWQNKPVFVKLFYARQSAQRDFENELRGYHALQERGIATARLIDSATLADEPVYALISENLEPAPTLKSAWRQMDGQAGAQAILLEKAIELLAQHHNARLIHQDPHLNNFLLKDNCLYTLDMSDIRVFDKVPDELSCLKNLAVFLAIFPAEIDSSVADLFRRYRQLRTDEIKTGSDALLQAIRRQRLRSRERYLSRKILRECSEFIRVRDFGRLLIYRRDADSRQMRQFLYRPDDYIDKHARAYLKKGRSATVAVIAIDNRDFVVKRYNVKNFGKALSHACKRSRALNSWIGAHRLLVHGVTTARPVALMEKRFGPLRRNAYFLTEYVEGIDARAYFAARPQSIAEQQKGVSAMAALLCDLHVLQVCHGDLKATNFLIADGKPYLMDLDSLRPVRNRRRFRRRFHKDLQRFLQNWADTPELQARFADKLGPLFERLK